MKYLIFGGVGIGDTIIELSLAKGIKENDKSAQVYLLINNATNSHGAINEILGCQNYIDCSLTYSKKDVLGIILTLLRLKRLKIDYGFFCAPKLNATDTPSKVCRLIGCKSIMKQMGKRTGKIDIPVAVSENINIVKQYECLFNVLYPEQKLNVEVLDPVKLEPLVKIDTFGKKIVGVCLGTNITNYKINREYIPVNIKEWGISKWCKLGNALTEKGYKVIFLGGEKEKNALSSQISALNEFVETKYCGQTTVKESISILQQCDLVIGADTGMMHCAAALGKSTLSLFGGTPANVWHPYSKKNKVIIGVSDCSPCWGKEHAIECKNRKCMESIDFDEVLNTAITILQCDQNNLNFEMEHD